MLINNVIIKTNNPMRAIAVYATKTKDGERIERDTNQADCGISGRAAFDGENDMVHAIIPIRCCILFNNNEGL